MFNKKDNYPPALKADFLVSAVHRKQFPEALYPEIMLLGRSNAGKSSLLNKWLGRKSLARTSSTPGRTRQINFFQSQWTKDSPEFIIADLPGYGYAAAPKNMVQSWHKLTLDYLHSERKFYRALLIMDIRRNPAEEEINLTNWLNELSIPLLVVATKIDKLSHNAVKQSLKMITETLKAPSMGFSSVNGMGRNTLIESLNLV